MEFLELFMDCFLCPLSLAYADLESNPLLMGMLVILMTMGLVSIARKLVAGLCSSM